MVRRSTFDDDQRRDATVQGRRFRRLGPPSETTFLALLVSFHPLARLSWLSRSSQWVCSSVREDGERCAWRSGGRVSEGERVRERERGTEECGQKEVRPDERGREEGGRDSASKRGRLMEKEDFQWKKSERGERARERGRVGEEATVFSSSLTLTRQKSAKTALSTTKHLITIVIHPIYRLLFHKRLFIQLENSFLESPKLPRTNFSCQPSKK